MAQLPITVLTGFLGSGKTTLLNRLLADPAMAETAVIINEFGSVPLDHLLVEQAIENIVTLQSGCVCCTIRGDLVDTLLGLYARSARGEIPRFSRVVVETTGLAEPGPIIQTLAEDRALLPLFRLRGVVATVDAINGHMQLSRYAEAVKQIAAAGLVIVTKTDIADAAHVSALREDLQLLNPTATVEIAVAGDIPPERVFEGPTWEPGPDLETWLPAAAFRQATPIEVLSTHRGRMRHADRPTVEATCLTSGQPVSAKALSVWLDALVSLRGADILRLKGIVHIAGRTGPTVIQGVQHLLHPPRDLPRWPDENVVSRLIVIGRSLPAAGLRAALAAAMAAHPAQET